MICVEGERPPSVCRTLPSGVVNGVLPIQDDLGDRHKGVALLNKGGQDAGQRLRRMFGCVVEQDDGPGLDFPRDTLRDLLGGDLFPVQAVVVLNQGSKRDVISYWNLSYRSAAALFSKSRFKYLVPEQCLLLNKSQTYPQLKHGSRPSPGLTSFFLSTIIHLTSIFL